MLKYLGLICIGIGIGCHSNNTNNTNNTNTIDAGPPPEVKLSASQFGCSTNGKTTVCTSTTDWQSIAPSACVTTQILIPNAVKTNELINVNTVFDVEIQGVDGGAQATAFVRRQIQGTLSSCDGGPLTTFQDPTCIQTDQAVGTPLIGASLVGFTSPTLFYSDAGLISGSTCCPGPFSCAVSTQSDIFRVVMF